MSKQPLDQTIDQLMDEERMAEAVRDIRLAASGPEMIDQSNIDYLQQVYAGHAEAQEKLKQAERLDQQAMNLRMEAQSLIGAHNSYVLYLFKKYSLQPDQDRIESDGRILRQWQQAAAPRPERNGS